MIPTMHHVDNFSPTELHEIFPEALPIIKSNLKIYKNALKQSKPIYSELLDCLLELIYGDKALNTDASVAWATRRFYQDPINALEKNITRLKHLLSIYTFKGSTSAQTITDADVDQARTFPIGNIVELNRSNFMRCLFHSEKTPSCKVFKDNKFRCFGCGANGDVIDIVCKVQGIQFLDAVRFILKR